MHLVTKSYFDAFCEEYNFAKGETKSFEAFCNFCAANFLSDDDLNPEDLIYEGADPGIDCALLFVDGRAIFTVDELNVLLGGGKREYDFQFLFTQDKSSENWRKGEIDTFSAALVDLISDSPAQPLSDYLIEFRKLFSEVYGNIKRVRGGLPSASAYFISAAQDTDAAEINAAITIASKALTGTGYFKNVTFEKIHRERLHELWLSAGATDEATIPVSSFSAFPSAPGVNSAYIAPISAKDFIQKVLKNADGSRKKKLFEKNVRDFLGEDEEVNSEISETLADPDKRKRFGLMNNGVTIVAETVRPAGQSIFVSNYQIVNGCQTSSVLLHNEAEVDDTVSLMVKIIESNDTSTIADIVRATNRQSAVQDEQFSSTLDILRDLEAYFNARGAGHANRLVLERRKGQYRNENIPQARVVDIRELARAISATRMLRPDLASRYVGRLTGEMRDQVFVKEASEELFYLSCFASYRLRILISNKKFDARYSKLRWHILCVSWFVSTRQFKGFGEKRAEDAFENLFAANDGVWFDRLRTIVTIVFPDFQISRDVLKGQAFNGALIKAASEIRWSAPD
ncbi:MAG TPA: AIPR family protein [Amaricoccus sp.]|uniref:AIPR family protein n=1 Tax=Amaricoccus sp. TaxID=1872485 RepID=UPI002BA8B1DC|nr:AIPR family protein [Amaricoccus sp.]HMQ94173.1 AIPR family protein [Amaricoccus sp.]HMR52699.1 AIPR family protein [Amaricoccus sp.]HMT99670.1 AIPR family protein [Amaricoccus sp.]